MRKTTQVALLSAIIVTASGLSVSAHETTATTGNSVADEAMKTKKEEMMKLKEEKESKVSENRKEIKENRAEFKSGSGAHMQETSKNLTETEKTKVKEIEEAYKKAMDEAQAKYKTLEKTEVNAKAMMEEMKAIHDKYHSMMKEALANNPEALKILENKISELRHENKEIKVGYKEKKSELVMKCKKAFADKFSAKIEKIPADKLKVISEKVGTVITKIEARTDLTSDAKEKIIAQYKALKELIDEKLNNSSTSVESQIEAMLNN